MSAKWAVLDAVDREMGAMGLTYAFEVFKNVPTYPYFVGSYFEDSRSAQENKSTGSFTIRGWSRGDIAGLIDIEEKIKARFTNYIGLESRATVALDSAISRPIPQESNELYAIEIQMDARAFGL